MIPILFDSLEKSYSTWGIGHLKDAIECAVEEEGNGVFILKLLYPVGGVLYDELALERQILAMPNAVDRAQPFRIVEITEPISGVVTIEAEHVHYQTNDIPVFPFTADNAPDAASRMVANSVVANPFTFSTTKTTRARFEVKKPMKFRQLLGGVQGSMLDVFGGGEYEFDRYSILLHAKRGRDDGAKIQYGKDLIDYEQEKSIRSLVSGVAPYWTNGEGQLVTLPEKYIAVAHNYAYTRVVEKDFSSEFDDPPTAAQLRAATQKYIDSTDLTSPKVSIKVKFQPLWDTSDYESHPLYPVLKATGYRRVFDIVTVEFPSLNGTEVKAKINRTLFNVLLEHYDEIDIGDVRASFGKTVLDQQKELEQTPSVDFMERAIRNATDLITGQAGGHIIFRPKVMPQEMLIMDTDDIVTAKRVWRYNLNGWGYSSTGPNGPYRLAATMDGALVADFITAGTLNAAIVNVINLNADNINAGTLKSQNNTTSLNLNNGKILIATDNGTLQIYRYGILLNRDGEPQGTDFDIGIFINDAGRGMVQAGSFDFKVNNFARSFAYMDDNRKIKVFADELNVNNIALHRSEWVWNGQMGRYVLCSITS